MHYFASKCIIIIINMIYCCVIILSSIFILYIVYYHVLVCEYCFHIFNDILPGWQWVSACRFSSNYESTSLSSKVGHLTSQLFRLWLVVHKGLRISDKRSTSGIRTICNDVNRLGGWQKLPNLRKNAEGVTSSRRRPCSSPLCELLRAGRFKLLPAMSNYGRERLRNQYQIRADLFCFLFSAFRSMKQTAGGEWGAGLKMNVPSSDDMCLYCEDTADCDQHEEQRKKGVLSQTRPGCSSLQLANDSVSFSLVLISLHGDQHLGFRYNTS